MKSIYKTEKGRQKILDFYSNLLENWVQPSKQVHVNTSHGNAFVVESGEKTNPTVVLLHGSSSNSAMWCEDVKVLSSYYHVLVIDIPGECGLSDEKRFGFNSENYANWLSEVLSFFQLDSIYLVGCSLGGWIALDYAIKFPQKVKKLILLATAGITPIKLGTVFWIILTSISGQWGFNKLNRLVYRDLPVDEKTLEFAMLIKNNFIPRTDVLSIFPESQLKKVEAKTLFLGGELDCFYNSAKTAERMKKHILICKADVIPGTGHVLINQTEKIIQFLEEK